VLAIARHGHRLGLGARLVGAALDQPGDVAAPAAQRALRVDVAALLGFVEVMPETLPYSEQLRLFSEAEVVTGPHGSGLANAIYMARGTGLCELAPARLHAEKVPNFWNLAACGRQRYGVCVGSGRRVNPKRFKRVLRSVILAARRERSPTQPTAEREAQTADPK